MANSELFRFFSGITLAHVATIRPLTETEKQILADSLNANPFGGELPTQEPHEINGVPDGPFEEDVDDPDSTCYDRRHGERSQWLGISPEKATGY
jgi:hypothetical protein